jgi:ABC-2 type transport system permease protein
MKQIWTIAKKELLIILTTPVGYIFAGLLLTICGWMFFDDLFVSGRAEMTTYWQVLSYLMIMFVPAMAMNMVADEKRNSTWEVLLTLPISERNFVLGKFLGYGLYIVGVFAMILPVIVTVFLLGNPDIGIIFGGWLGNLLMALAYLTIGMFVSAQTTQPVAAFLISVVIMLVNNLIGQEMMINQAPAILKIFLSELSLQNHMYNFSTGLIILKDMVFFVSWMIIFVLATITVLKNRDK